MTRNDPSEYTVLIKAIESLTLHHQELRAELETLQREVTELRRGVEEDRAIANRQTRVVAVEVVDTESADREIRIGDRVEINNPGRLRTNEGIVIGTTIGGFLRIELSNGQTIRRLPRNVSRKNE